MEAGALKVPGSPGQPLGWRWRPRAGTKAYIFGECVERRVQALVRTAGNTECTKYASAQYKWNHLGPSARVVIRRGEMEGGTGAGAETWDDPRSINRRGISAPLSFGPACS